MKPSHAVRGVIQQSLAALGRPFIRTPDGILPPISRNSFRRLIPRPVLEIGPSGNPFLKGAGVEYFDIFDQEELKKRAPGYEYDPEDCPFIHHTGSLDEISNLYAAAFSSHAIEHTPDLIAHLRQVSRLLEPGGAYFVIVPDRRYCFDHFLPGTMIEDVRAGIGRDRPTITAIENHYLRHAHNHPALHWIGIHGSERRNEIKARTALDSHRVGEYIDVHQWSFTPESFRNILTDLDIFSEVAVFDTAFATLEFMAILSSSAR